jgi:hypothetical protein
MKIQYDNIAENYVQFREGESDAVEKLILGSGISSTSKPFAYSGPLDCWLL